MMEINSHVKHGYLADVLEPFLYEGSEWGDQMRAIHSAYSMGEDYAGLSEEELDWLRQILMRHLEYAYQNGDLDEEPAGDPEAFKRACTEYERIHHYWKDRLRMYRYSTKAMQDAQASFQLADDLIPDWMKHVSN